MEIGRKFGTILDGYFDKDDLIEILEEFNISKAGKKDELVKRIQKNTTVLEYAIKGLLRDSYKEQLVDISQDLEIDSSGNASELKQDILDELEKDTDDKSLQNKITFLDACFDKDTIIEIMEEFYRPKAGKKVKLVEVIAKNQSMLEYAIKLGIRDAYKEDIEDVCDKLGIDSDGNKKDLEKRINDFIFKKEKTSNKVISNKFEKSTSNQNNVQIEDKKKNINFKNKKKFKKYNSTFLKIINTIQNEFHPDPSSDEKELQGNLNQFLKIKYPGKKIEREVSVGDGKVDFVIDEKYAIELKLARNSSTLRNLIGQLEEYQEVYPQIVVLLLNIIEISDIEKIKNYVERYRAKGIPTIIVEGRTRKPSGGLKKLKLEIE